MKRSVCKLISLTLCLIVLMSVVCVHAEESVVLYAEDGRSQAFPASEVDLQLTVGWYKEPVQRLYAEGKSKLFPVSEVDLQLTVGWYKEPVQRLYAEGKSRLFPVSEVDLQLTVGWYKEPVQRLYAEGKSKLFFKSDVAAQLAVGWSVEPVQRLYAVGKSQLFKKSDVPAQLLVGWSIEPLSRVYSLDGRTKYVTKSMIEANKKVGWYPYSDYVVAKAAQLQKKSYSDAAYFLQNAVTAATTVEDYNMFYGLLKNYCANWYGANDWRPVFIEKTYLTSIDGAKGVVIEMRNLTQKKIAKIELQFTCFDKNGNETCDAEGYSGVVNADADSVILSPAWSYPYKWKLSSYSQVASVGNVTLKKVYYSDGSVWERF